MTRKHVQWLVAIVVGLLLLVFVLDTTDDTGPLSPDAAFLAGFAADANRISEVEVRGLDEDGSVIVRRAGDSWVVSSRDDYPADIGTLRPIIVALAEARIVEEKTANADYYDRLGVDDPDSGGSGTKLTLSGDDFAYSVILGNSAQGDFRYARQSGEGQSVLIDRNPDVPGSLGDWLVGEIVDLPATRMRKVTLTHADGETITIGKDTEEQTDFSVFDVPEGRELAYPSVGNGIGGALAALELDDVRAAIEAEAAATAIFETWDGLRITASVIGDGENAWIGFRAESIESQPPASGEAPASAEQDTANAEESGVVAEPQADSESLESAVTAINDRVGGWHYRVPDYKKNLLLRRWSDILKADDAGESAGQ